MAMFVEYIAFLFGLPNAKIPVQVNQSHLYGDSLL